MSRGNNLPPNNIWGGHCFADRNEEQPQDPCYLATEERDKMEATGSWHGESQLRRSCVGRLLTKLGLKWCFRMLVARWWLLFSEIILLPPKVEILEMLATRRAATLAVELWYYWVIFEEDFEIVFKALSRGVSPLSSPGLGYLVKDYTSIKFYLRAHSFSYIKRQDNFVGYALLRKVRFSFSLLV